MRLLICAYLALLSSCGLRFAHNQAPKPHVASNIIVPEHITGIPNQAREFPKHADKNNDKTTRLVITNSQIKIEVANTQDAAKKIEAICNACNGHIEKQYNNSLCIRVPTESFSQAIEDIEKIGAVLSKHINRQDVTNKLRDDNVRLENLLAMQKRLLVLIDKSDSIKDTLAIEKELSRITEQIELIKAVLKKSADQVRLSTIHIELRELQRWGSTTYNTPFAWVERIGMSIGQTINRRNSTPRRWLRYDRPEGFVAWYERCGVSKLISADQTHILITRHRNIDGGDLSFWSETMQQFIAKNGIVDTQTQTVPAYKDHFAHVSSGTKTVRGKTYTCNIAVICTAHYIYTVESWGPAKSVLKHAGKFPLLYASMRVR